MQTLWARVAQVRSTCRCSLCASPVNGLTQRVTGVPVWRRVSQGDVFVVFSSTLVFEAAVYDSVRKDLRSKQWDKAIAEGKEQIAATEADHKRRAQVLLDNVERRKAEDEVEETSLYGERVEWTWQGIFSWTGRLDELRTAEGFDGWKGVPHRMLRQLTASELQELQSQKRIHRRFYGGPDCEHLEPEAPTTRISTQKLRTQEWSMAKLVLKIVWVSCGQGAYDKFVTSSFRSQREYTRPWERNPASVASWPDLVIEAQSKLTTLFSHPAGSDIYDKFERPPLPCYNAPIEDYDGERIRLNGTLHMLLQEMKDQGDMQSHLAKICQHLLLSRTPPNVHAYNLLLVRFCQLKEVSLVHFVLEAMWESHIRPNEITHATVLRFFTITNNKAEFSQYVKRMRGLKGGLALADPDRPLSPLVGSRVHIFGERMHKVAEKARMNQEVYTALIIGLLRFFNPEDAMYWYRGMIDQGWRPTAELLIALLRECCLGNDWPAGLAVWQQFSKEAIRTTSLAYEWMLRLCHCCEQHYMYRNILEAGVREGVLPQGILNFAHQFRSRDASLVIADAQREPAPIIDRKIVNYSLRWRFSQLQKFDAREGRLHLLNNALSGAVNSEAEMNAKIQDCVHNQAKLVWLRTRFDKHNTTLSKLSDDIALTISEIGSQLPMIGLRKSILKIGLFESGQGIMPSELSSGNVSSFYEEYRQRSAGQLEQVITLESPPQIEPGSSGMSI